MTFKTLKKGLNALVQTVFPYPQYRYYGVEVVEGYERPCFFTRLEVTTEPANLQTIRNKATYYITYFQKKLDEVDILEKIDGIRPLFYHYVNIEDRAIKVVDFSWDFVGTDRDIIEIAVELEYYTKIPEPEPGELMEHYTLKLSNKDETEV